MSTPKDDLEAVRAVIDAIKDFESDEQQRIFRWVAEKLGLPQPFAAGVHTLPPAAPSPGGTQPPAALSQPLPGGTVDIKTFIATKKPRNDVQFAATVAYYYRFEAPPTERKDAIDKEDLQEATRKAGRDRFSNPLTTLSNAHKLGLLDKGAEKATFTINSVGENLVAMTLPDGTGAGKPAKKRAAKKTGKSTTNAPARKKKKGVSRDRWATDHRIGHRRSRQPAEGSQGAWQQSGHLRRRKTNYQGNRACMVQ